MSRLTQTDKGASELKLYRQPILQQKHSPPKRRCNMLYTHDSIHRQVYIFYLSCLFKKSFKRSYMNILLIKKNDGL